MYLSLRSFSARRLLLALAALAFPGAALAQLPAARLYSVFPPGGQAGQSVDVAITGVDLELANKLIFSQPGIAAVQKTVDPNAYQQGPQPVPNQFTITIPADCPPGRYEVRAIGKFGVSNSRMFVVGTQPEILEKEPNNDLKTATETTLGTVINGKSNSATDLDFYKFAAQTGQRVLVDCLAERIDSRMDATLALFDPNGRQIATNRDTTGRDPLLDYTIPADGIYTVKIYDFVYGGSDDFVYRLSIGTGPYLDFVFPPAGQAGTTGAYTAYGRNLPGGVPADGLAIDGHPLQKLPVQIAIPGGADARQPSIGVLVGSESADLDAIDYRLTTPQGTSNAVLISATAAAVVAEVEPNDAPEAAQKITLPGEFVGQFQTTGDIDGFAFEGKAGTAYWVEVLSHRFGRMVDPQVVIQRIVVNDQGEQTISDVIESDDTRPNIGGNDFTTLSEDPAFAFTVPADGNYWMLLKNQFGGGDPRDVYRVSVREARPDFRLAVFPKFPSAPNQPAGVWSTLLRKGGSDLLEVLAFRKDGFAGEINVTVEGLPAGVTAQPVTIGPGMNSAPLVLMAAEDAAETIVPIQVVGKAAIADAEVVRTARSGAAVWESVGNAPNASAPARLTQDLMLAVSAAEVAPFVVDAGQGQLWETSRAGTLEIPIKITRRGEFKGAINFAPIGPPPNVQVPGIALNPDQAELPLKLTLPPNAPLGTFTFYLNGTTTVSYRRNPELAEAATAFKASLEKLVAEQTEAQKKADADKAAATTEAQTAAANAKTATDAKTAADKVAVDAAAAAKAALDKFEAAKKAAEADANNKDLADAKAAAEKESADAAAKSKTADEAKVAADKAAEDAAAKAKTADEKKAAAEKAAVDAAELLKATQAALTAATAQATALTNAANPANINMNAPTTPIVIKITAAPITSAVTAPGALKQGAEVQVPVTITRLYNYNDPVDLEAVIPNGVAGLQVAKVTIPAGENAGVVVIKAAANATVGQHNLNIRATARLNNQPLQVDQPVLVTVEAP
ncbi:MAG: PPC domain-containing protein [Pirellulales bacterium]